MKLVVAALAAIALLVSPAATSAKSYRPPGVTGSIPANAKILIMQPDVELSMLIIGGAEPKADWSEAGTNNFRTAIEAAMRAKSHEIRSLNPDDAMEGRPGQLLRLHTAVGDSIMSVSYGFLPLPTKKNNFVWTLGPGAQELATKYDADYALFTVARGSFSSGGRIAAQIALAALGVGVAGGGTQAYTSLVDLRTGQVVWFNFTTIGDLRNPTGAASSTASLLKGAPL